MTFTQKYPNTTRYVAIDETNPLNGEPLFTIYNEKEKEILMIEFTKEENECYVSKGYPYSYNDGVIDMSVRNSFGNFTEIINLIKSDNKKIEDFYPDNCNFVDVEFTLE